MLEVNRFFSVINQETGLIEWYFRAREGNFGPYQSIEQAEFVLEEFITNCVVSGQLGGRGPIWNRPANSRMASISH